MNYKNRDNLIVDKLGWIDDWRALPGECGNPLSRDIYAYALMSSGKTPKEMKEMGFSKKAILKISKMIIEESYND